MSNVWKWTLGIAVVLIILVGMPFLWGTTFPTGGYRMMNDGWHMPMGFGGAGMMGIGMLFVWLIPPGLLVLIALACAWLIRSLSTPK